MLTTKVKPENVLVIKSGCLVERRICSDEESVSLESKQIGWWSFVTLLYSNN